jgi:hypothetical protein
MQTQSVGESEALRARTITIGLELVKISGELVRLADGGGARSAVTRDLMREMLQSCDMLLEQIMTDSRRLIELGE